MKKFDKIHDIIKYKAFGKVTIGNTNKKEKMDKVCINVPEEEKAKLLLEEQKKD